MEIEAHKNRTNSFCRHIVDQNGANKREPTETVLRNCCNHSSCWPLVDEFFYESARRPEGIEIISTIK